MDPGVWLHEVMNAAGSLLGHCPGAPRTRTVQEAAGAFWRKALDPFAPGRVGTLEGLGNGVKATAVDDFPDGLSTSKDAHIFGVLEHGVTGREGL